jgi:hypothetical protein
LVQELPAEAGHGLSDGGFQEAAVPDSVGATVLDYQGGVKFEHVLDVEEFRIHSASSFKAAR